MRKRSPKQRRTQTSNRLIKSRDLTDNWSNRYEKVRLFQTSDRLCLAVVLFNADKWQRVWHQLPSCVLKLGEQPPPDATKKISKRSVEVHMEFKYKVAQKCSGFSQGWVSLLLRRLLLSP